MNVCLLESALSMKTTLFVYFDSWAQMEKLAKNTEMIKLQGEIVSQWAAKEQDNARKSWKKIFKL